MPTTRDSGSLAANARAGALSDGDAARSGSGSGDVSPRSPGTGRAGHRRHAEFAGNFRQYEPDEGEAATERTEVRVLYDDSALYVGVRLYDSEPDKIVARLSRRDENPDADRFTFYVDALHDGLTGAAFEVSAAAPKWRNLLCDVDGLAAHIREDHDIFVTMDSHFLAASRREALIALGAGDILTPEQALAKVVAGRR